MSFGQHIRFAGAIMTIIGTLSNTGLVTFLGFMIIAIGIVVHLDNIEHRMRILEEKNEKTETTES